MRFEGRADGSGVCSEGGGQVVSRFSHLVQTQIAKTVLFTLSVNLALLEAQLAFELQPCGGEAAECGRTNEWRKRIRLC